MSLEEAVALGQKAIYHATHRDSASGGVVRGIPLFSHSVPYPQGRLDQYHPGR